MHESWEGLIVRIKGGGLAKTVTLGNIYIGLQEVVTMI